MKKIIEQLKHFHRDMKWDTMASAYTKEVLLLFILKELKEIKEILMNIRKK